MGKGLYDLRLIDNNVGRERMVGWLVKTPEGQGKIVSIDEGTVTGLHIVTVFMLPGETGKLQYREFDAAFVDLL
jgi:hypothetical protein